MKSTTEPFRVTCEMLDGRINSADGLIFLDSILYHAWFCKYAPEVLEGFSRDDHPPHFGLPLRQLPGGRYAASCGFYRQYSTDIEYWNKRADFATQTEYLDPGRATKINTSSGLERVYRMPNVVRTIGPVEFYGYGTIEKVKDLLTHMSAVGKKPAAGWGAVKSWTVGPWPEDWSTWSEQYGLMRPMPVEEYDGADKARYKVGLCAIRPPAWKACNQVVCCIPEVANQA